jgi:exo-beta-1,3-glucanase (GH17 family)
MLVMAILATLPGRLHFSRNPLEIQVVAAEQDPPPLRCVAFSPYVQGYDAEWGPHPLPDLIAELLDATLAHTGADCIQTYGVLNGLDATFEAARVRDVKVIAIVWLDTSASANATSIAKGIEVARAYAGTIVRISCGSEVRVRHGAAVAEPIIRDCLTRMRAAGVTQPLTSIDTWWGWCNERWPCGVWPLASDLDWIGINVFPWWENKFSGLFPCTSAENAAAFHLARLQDVAARYPDLHVILTEYGWPAGPDGYSEQNMFTGQRCGIASAANQHVVTETTRQLLIENGRSGVVFEAVREPWKERYEGLIGGYWGLLPYPLPLLPDRPSNLRVVPRPVL